MKTNEIHQDKKVCIIIPVYNAEKFLDCCLNSVLHQTYSNWIAILVDDGSKDTSAEICQRYAQLDSRFRFYSKANGGVSSARNMGLSVAEGDYLEFLDSDDCLTQDALEQQVAYAQTYHAFLVVNNSITLDFHNPEMNPDKRTVLSSRWLGASPYVMTKEDFHEKKMRLTWFTALMECPWAKLYDLTLWKKLNLTFPEDMSLGEDFVTNMQYYHACDRMVFVNEAYHYYNFAAGSGSLAEKYRPDLFEIKMYLMEQIEANYGNHQLMSDPEKDAFYCYAANSGLFCVEKAVLNSRLKKKELLNVLHKMVAHPLFAESIQCASYIPEPFADCMEDIRQGHLRKVIRCVEKNARWKASKRQNAANSENEQNPSVYNRVIRWILGVVMKLLGDGCLRRKIARLIADLEEYGIRYILKRCHRSVRRHIKELLQHNDSYAAK